MENIKCVIALILNARTHITDDSLRATSGKSFTISTFLNCDTGLKYNVWRDIYKLDEVDKEKHEISWVHSNKSYTV